jgi:two-component system LytT family response regulator
MLRTLIIDDELSNRQFISTMLEQHFPNVEVIGEAEGVASGLEAIRRLSPDLVLLDIRMEDGEGFDILTQLGAIEFKIIFITAFEEYALKAIKFSALDYLLKPVSLQDMKTAISKAENQIVKDLHVQLVELNNNLQSINNKKIVLRSVDKLQIIPVQDIVRAEADRNYTNFFINTGKKITVSYPLRDYEDMLIEQGFFRIHKSHIVNLTFIESYVKSDGGYITLSDGSSLPVADRKKAVLLEIINRF